MTLVIRCAWLINPAEAPRENVRISVVDGIVEEICDLPCDERSAAERIAVMPRFVNAHTHLEFSSRMTPIQPSSPFQDWIRSVIRYRQNQMQASTHDSAVETGVVESAKSGTSLIGEITTSDSGLAAAGKAASSNDTNIVCFRELIGFRHNSIDEQLAIAKHSIDHCQQTPGVVPGLSPHAPYSVHSELFEGIVDTANQNDTVVAMHLAETKDELILLQERRGGFVSFLNALNLWDESALGEIRSILPYLQKLAQTNRSLAVHCNYLNDAEIRFLSQNPHVAVVYCPRTHAYFGHTNHPWQKLTDAGATVILGTDSRASNPDLSIWKELQFIARQPGARSVSGLLPMITTAAAAALGQSPDKFRIRMGEKFSAVSCPCSCETESGLSDALLAEDAVPKMR